MAIAIYFLNIFETKVNSLIAAINLNTQTTITTSDSIKNSIENNRVGITNAISRLNDNSSRNVGIGILKGFSLIGLILFSISCLVVGLII
jgi:hypothetical protein